MPTPLLLLIFFVAGMILGVGVGFYIWNVSHRCRGDRVLTAADIKALEDIRHKLDSLGRKE